MKTSTDSKMVLLTLAVSIALGAAGVSCHNRQKVAPEEFDQNRSELISQITVVRHDGTEEKFINGWIDDEIFVGIDSSYAPHEIRVSEISHFVIETFSKRQTIALGSVLILPATALGLIFSSISCPHVYAFDGEMWTLDAEPFSGAIARNAQKTDLAVLEHIRPVEGTYRLKILNESNEIEFTDEIKLVIADHPASVEVLPGIDGKIVTVAGISPPVYAKTHTGRDLMALFGKDGSLSWEGDPGKGYADPARPREEIHLKFPKPTEGGTAKLVVRGQNTYWSFRMMDDFLSTFGSLAEKKLKSLDGNPKAREKIERFMKENGIWIEVLVKKSEEWAQAGFIPEVGPNVAKTQVLTLEVPEETGPFLEVKLRWAPLFWHILKIGMDFSRDAPGVSVIEEGPLEAADAGQGDIGALIAKADGETYRTEKGAEALVEFSVPPGPAEGMKRTVLIKATGYYHMLVSKKKKASTLEMMNIILKKKGIDAYSLEQYHGTKKDTSHQ
jgi:hypothetical protein